MVRNDDGPPPEARPPLLTDLIALCRSLNREGARYIVIGNLTTPDTYALNDIVTLEYNR